MRAVQGITGFVGMVLAAMLAMPAAASDVPEGPLPRDVVPSLVQLELRIDQRQERFSGTTRIEAALAKPLQTIWMHGRDLDITRAEAVLADGRRVALDAEQAHVSGVLRLKAGEPLPAGPLAIELEYNAPYGKLEGAYRARQAELDYVLTQMEPLGARKTFPGFDEPSFKQPWDITLLVREDDVAVANTPETSRESAGDGWTRVRFARSEALPSYLIAFAVGPWDIVEGPHIAVNGKRTTPIPFRTLVAKGQSAKTAYGREHTPAIVQAMEDYFGSPYPFEKLDNLAAPDFAFGAMENAGLIIYRDAYLFTEAGSPGGNRLAFWMVSAHELAHQWFGNLVTMRWWDDLWLNEAFASWMGYKVAHQLQPALNADRDMLAATLRTMNLDSLATTRRIGEPIRNFTDIQSAFDPITYEKGGAVLDMIEHYVGEQDFRDGVRDYLAANARGNATRDQLFSAIAARSDEPQGVLAVLDSFIEQPGVPELNVSLDCSGKTPTLRVRQRRYLPAGSTASADQHWTVPMCVRYADDGDAIGSECALVAGRQATMPLREASTCPAWVMPNGDARGYYRYVLDDELQARATAHFGRLNEREQQAYADALDAGFKAGTLAPSAYLQALPALANARSSQAATAPLSSVRWIWEYLLDEEPARDTLRAQVADIYRPRLMALGFEPRDDDGEDDRSLRETLTWMLAYRLRDPGVRAPLATKGRAVLGLDGDGQLDADAISVDQRGNALVFALQEGGVAAFDAAERHLRASEDPLLRGDLLNAMALVEDPVLAERARALLLDPQATRVNEFSLLGTQSGVPQLRPALRAWMDAHVDRLEQRTGPFVRLGQVWVDASGRCTVEEADALEARYGGRMDDVEGGPLALAQSVEGVRLCAARKQAHAGREVAFPR